MERDRLFETTLIDLRLLPLSEKLATTSQEGESSNHSRSTGGSHELRGLRRDARTFSPADRSTQRGQDSPPAPGPPKQTTCSSVPHPYTEADAQKWIALVRQDHATGRPRRFAIVLKETDRLIGGVGLDGSTGDESAEPSLGYWSGQPHWGQRIWA